MSVYQIKFLTGTFPIYAETQIPLVFPDSGILPDGSIVRVFYVAGNVPLYKVVIIPSKTIYGITGSVTYNINCGNNVMQVQWFPTGEGTNIFEVVFTIPCVRLGNPIFVNIRFQEQEIVSYC